LPRGSSLFRTDLIPNSGDGYTLSQLGSGTSGGVTIDTGFIKYVVNGSNQGALGNGATGPGIQFDVTGSGSYGSDDMFTPGTPWEAFVFYINDSYYLGGSNSPDYPQGTQYFTNHTTTKWDLSRNNVKHVVCLKGAAAQGYIVLQYMTVGRELAIRMRMSYTNTTGSAVTVKAGRVVDPDVEYASAGTYNTINNRGFGTLSAKTFVSGVGASTGKILALYAMPGSLTQNTSVYSGWPSAGYDLATLLSDNDADNGDRAIGVAWDAGTVASGATVVFNCAYLCGTSLSTIQRSMGLV
jgi:hypothetical protein